MRKTIHMIMAGILVMGILTPVFAGEATTGKEVGWFRRIFARLEWNELKNTVSTPKDISASVRHNVEYRKDGRDQWASGQETWDRGYGDCEDFAAIVTELCRKIDVETVTLIFHPVNSAEGHAVVMGEWKGRVWISSNGWFQYVKSLDEAKQEVAREMGWRRQEIAAVAMEQIDDDIQIATGISADKTVLLSGPHR